MEFVDFSSMIFLSAKCPDTPQLYTTIVNRLKIFLRYSKGASETKS